MRERFKLYQSDTGMLFSRNNISREGSVLYAPIYLAFCLGELTDAGMSDFTFAPIRL